MAEFKELRDMEREREEIARLRARNAELLSWIEEATPIIRWLRVEAAARLQGTG
jgi:hypothetical protein